MTNCCAPAPLYDGMNRFFSGFSKRYAKRFRKKGLEKVQRLLLEGVRKEPVAQRRVLDIGCGVGALHLTLLKEGATKSVGIDISEGMIEHARKLAADLGVSDRVEYLLGDFVDLAGRLEEADITMLDKVVCCYDKIDLLIERSAGKTRRIYALTHPRNSFPVKQVVLLQIALAKLLRRKFRSFWHNWDRLRDLVAARGFELMYENSTVAWTVLVFRRAGQGRAMEGEE